MPLTPADSELFGPMFAQPAVAALFTDEAYVRRLLRVEAALARAQAAQGVIPAAAGARVSRAAAELRPDFAALRAGLQRDGVPVAALVEQLRGACGDQADWVHFGATSQDVVDTAFVLAAREALSALRAELLGVSDRLAALAGTHRATLMAGRTHGQQALPVPFGLKLANVLAPLTRHLERLGQLEARLYALSLGLT